MKGLNLGVDPSCSLKVENWLTSKPMHQSNFTLDHFSKRPVDSKIWNLRVFTLPKRVLQTL